MTTKIGTGASGAIRRFAGWVARGWVGHPLLDGIDYWDELKDSPSQMETCFAIFANVLELDDDSEPIQREVRRTTSGNLALSLLHRAPTTGPTRP